MTEKLSKKQREYLRELVLDAQIRRFTISEALHFIADKLGVPISKTYYFRIKKQIVQDTAEQLHYYEDNKNAFVALYFDRIASGHKIEKELWNTYDECKEEKDHNGQLKSLLYLSQVGQYVNSIYDILPDMARPPIRFSPSDKKQERPYDDTVSYEEDPEAKF
jgi:hypothetical protein